MSCKETSIDGFLYHDEKSRVIECYNIALGGVVDRGVFYCKHSGSKYFCHPDSHFHCIILFNHSEKDYVFTQGEVLQVGLIAGRQTKTDGIYANEVEKLNKWEAYMV